MAEPMQEITEELALLPLFNMVVYPLTVTPLAVGQAVSIRLIDDAVARQQLIALVTLRDEQQRPTHITAADCYPVGTAALVHRLLRLPDGTLRVAIQGVERIQIVAITQAEPYLRARVRRLPDSADDDGDIPALVQSVVALATQTLHLLPHANEELHAQIVGEDDPARLAYLLAVALLLRSTLAERQEILELSATAAKLVQLRALLTRELEVLRAGQDRPPPSQSRAAPPTRAQMLRQQLDAILRELGVTADNQAEVERLRAQIAACGLPAEARGQAARALDWLAELPAPASEYNITRDYIETLCALPWQRQTADVLDVRHAQQVLDADISGHTEIKAHIVEQIAVLALRQTQLDAQASAAPRPILCFVGPPGVGKTALGQALARALGRKFVRVALGDLRDDAGLRGQRRVAPGAPLQAIQRASVRNPVLMLAGLDQLTPELSATLRAMLDPPHNSAFHDRYLDVAWDLAPVLFIASAQTLQGIPSPLLDRLEILPIAGYTAAEKLVIARRFLLVAQMAQHALTDADMQITDDALRVLIEEYTHEAGVTELERAVAALCRKVAVAVASGQGAAMHARIVDALQVRAYLGARRFFGSNSTHADAADKM